MARVVVIGGGFGGLASAARLAKLGHDVTLLERTATLGGALGVESEGGFTWDAGPTATLLPAVLRDLFRKSGRPLERELDLVPLDVVREHRFEDGTSVALPSGSRAAQIAAFDALGPGLGRRWVDHVTSRRTPTTGTCCAAATSSTRGSPTGCRARGPPASTAGRCCTGACAGPSRTNGSVWSPGTRSWPRATTCATCRPGRA